MKRNLPEIINMEQLYRLLRVSKRKAKWILDNGIIPCERRSTKTHTYIIRTEDVRAFMKLPAKEKRLLVPFGICGSNRPPKPKPTEITEKDYEGFTEFLTKKLDNAPETLTARDAAEFTGYCEKFFCRVIQNGELYAVSVRGRNYIPKSKLIEFLTTAIIDRKSPWHKEMIEKYLSKKSGKT